MGSHRWVQSEGRVVGFHLAIILRWSLYVGSGETDGHVSVCVEGRGACPEGSPQVKLPDGGRIGLTPAPSLLSGSPSFPSSLLQPEDGALPPWQVPLGWLSHPIPLTHPTCLVGRCYGWKISSDSG